MASFWVTVKRVIEESDVLLMVVDARDIDGTRNAEIEQKVAASAKPLIYVFNKCDLVDVQALQFKQKELFPSVFVSCKDYSGMGALRDRIMIESKRVGIKQPRVGVLGFPNMGKSSLINALGGGGKASTSSESGHTRGKQYVHFRNMRFIDTPGVLGGERDSVTESMVGISTKVKDPEGAVFAIMERNKGLLESHFDVEPDEDSELVLERIALKIKLLRKGGIPDTKRAAQKVLRDLREGKIIF